MKSVNTWAKIAVVGLVVLFGLSGIVWGVEAIHLQTQWEGGVLTMPCTVNGLKLRFIFDTGASSVCISSTEALFMLKNGYLDKSDIGATEQAVIANGDIIDNTKIILREVEVGGIHLQDVEAVVTHGLDAPLLFGQSAIRRLGTIQIHDGEVTIIPGTGVGIVDGQNIEQEGFDAEEYKRKGWMVQRDGDWYLSNSAPIEAKIRFFKFHAQMGDTDKMMALGNLYSVGKEVPQDFSVAFMWYRMAAEKGDAIGQYNTGLCFNKGQGVRQDFTEAKRWYAMAAAQGDRDAQYNLAVLYGDEQNYYDAGRWYLRAARAGLPAAQYNLAYLYDNGLGTAMNKPQAAYWYQQAANQGNAWAMNNLGLMYESGIGVRKNKKHALELYFRAMNIGNDVAENNYHRLLAEKQAHDRAVQHRRELRRILNGY